VYFVATKDDKRQHARNHKTGLERKYQHDTSSSEAQTMKMRKSLWNRDNLFHVSGFEE